MKSIIKILFFILLILSECKVEAQTSFYFQDFEVTSGWTLSPAISGNGNYWLFAGGLTSDHAYSGEGALIIADYWEGDWYLEYDAYAGHTDYSRTAARTFDFSTIPSGSDIELSYYIRCVGESGFDDLRLRVNDGGGWVVLDGPLTGIDTWAKRTIDLSAYAEEASVTVSFEWRNDGSVQNQPAARIDDVGIEYTTPCTAPANQATSFTSSNITSNTMDISWVRGTPDGGNEVIVVARAGGAVNANPANGATAYTANAAFSSGTEIGTGNYVVYKGTGTSVSLTGLDDDITYHYAVYEYGIDGGDNCYNLTALTGSENTLSCTSTTWTGVTSTAWINAANWSCGVPTTSIDVIIPDAATTTFSPTISATTTALCRDLTIVEGATLTMNCLVSSSGSLNIYGNIINNGNIHDNGDVFQNLYGTSKTISGFGTITGNGGGFYIRDEASYTLISNFSIERVWLFNSVSSILNIDSYYLTLNSVLVQEGSLNLGTGTVEYRGTSGNHIFTDSRFNPGTGLFYYNGDSRDVNQTVKSGTYYDLKVATVDGRTASIGSGSDITVSNDFTLENPGAAGGVVELDDDLYVNGTVNIGVTGNGLKLYTDWGFIQRSTGTGTTVFNMGDNDAHQIEIDWSWDSGVKSPFGLGASGAEIPLVFYGTVNYMNSGTGVQNVTAGSYKNLILSGLGSGTLGFIGNTSVNGDLTLSKTEGIVDFRTHEISLKGNLINNFSGTTQEPSTSDFVLNGTSAQLIEGSASTNFYNLKIDNNTNVTIERSASVKNEVVFTDGHFITADTKYLIFETGATESGAKASSHVNGPVQKLTNSTTAFKFPVGDGTAYRPAQILPASGDATTWTAKYNNVAYGTLGVKPPLQVVSEVEYWDLDRTGTANGTVTLWWDANSTVNTSDLSELSVAHFDSGDNLWEDAGNFNTTGNATAGSISSTVGWSKYSPFTIGSSEGSALPVTLTHFSINCKDENRTVLTWQTESEQNSNYFDVEKSVDGISWEVVGNVQAQGNSNSTHDYLWTDYSPYRGGVSYYRLRQVDFDGVYELFGPVSSGCVDNKHNVLDVYPNPTDGNVTMSYNWFNGEADAVLKLTDATGRLVQVQTVSLINGMNYYGFDLSSHAKGMYFITIEVEGEGINFARVVKQ